ncbi:LexA family protein, partial [Frankia casuarinae]
MTSQGRGTRRGGTRGNVRAFPEGPTDAGLTPRQRRVLEVIRAAVERRGYPPSVREIG